MNASPPITFFPYLSVMTFYSSIADLYDEIFPYQPQQKAFVEMLGLQGPKSNLLDVGCGTGSLVLHLAESFGTVVGMDPDKEMLLKANFKALTFKAERRNQLDELGNWVFLQKGMGDLITEFAQESFDVITCFGNTLVHLSNLAEVEQFLNKAWLLLKPGGKLIIQIINYDRIVDQNLTGLPTLETSEIRFERNYHYAEHPEIIRFETILTVKETGQLIKNEIPLLAIRTGELKNLLSNLGPAAIQEFANFAAEPFSPEAQPYIVVASK